jgi:hypothetical protein
VRAANCQPSRRDGSPTARTECRALPRDARIKLVGFVPLRSGAGLLASAAAIREHKSRLF